MTAAGDAGHDRTGSGGRDATEGGSGRRLGDARYGLWFGEGVRLGVGLEGDALEVGVPNAFFREWIQGHFADTLARRRPRRSPAARCG